MQGRNRRKCSYTILLLVSLAVAASVWTYGMIRSGEMGRWLSDAADQAQAVMASVREAAGDKAGGSDSMTVETAAGMGPEQKEMAGDEAEPETEEAACLPEGEVNDLALAESEEMIAKEGNEDLGQQPQMYTADRTYFDDALFIGDSRTVGLQEYGDLGNAEVVADLGMSVYKVFSQKFPTVSGEKKRLETVLSEQEFGKIYVMMGINELGYDFANTVRKYREMLERIRELQPQALIFLEANLHITQQKSASSPIYNNENIDRFNEALAQMADDKTIFYLDANELFDDGSGNLSEACTTDDTHILAKYYPDWTAWLLQHARKEGVEGDAVTY